MGPSKFIGAVMHLRKGALPSILVFSAKFLRVGLCSCGFLNCRRRGIVWHVGCDHDDRDASIA